MKRKLLESETVLEEDAKDQSEIENDSEDSVTLDLIVTKRPSPHVLNWANCSDYSVFLHAYVKRLLLITAFTIFGNGTLILMKSFQTLQELSQMANEGHVICPDFYPSAFSGVILIAIFPVLLIAIEKRNMKLLWVVLILTAFSGVTLVLSSIFVSQHPEHLMTTNSKAMENLNISSIQTQFGCCQAHHDAAKNESLPTTCCWKSGKYHRRGHPDFCETTSMTSGHLYSLECVESVQRFLRASALSTLTTIAYSICLLGFFGSYVGFFIYLLRKSNLDR